MPWINRSGVLRAWSRFSVALDDDRLFESFTEDRSLITRLCGDHHTNIWLSDHAAYKIEMLLGPHHRTIIKAWQAKQEK